ncbi:MAG: acyl-CoA carboxylase subunit epsilon [Cellulomonadaceae bacterium]|nr:acyl-CoA carboxylase subunit epsilon [Cellulomonadaceae bacterium]
MNADVRVVRGEPDDVELAALVAGLAAGQAAVAALAAVFPDDAHERHSAARRRWQEASRHLGDPLTPGPDAWRWSAHPRP